MRNGRLLEENSPKVLLEAYNQNTLEQVVLLVSRLADQKIKEAEGVISNLVKKELILNVDEMEDKNAIIVRYMNAVQTVKQDVSDIFIVEEELSVPPSTSVGGDNGSALSQSFWSFYMKATALLIKNFIEMRRNVG